MHTIEVKEAGVHSDEGREGTAVETIRNSGAKYSGNKHGSEETNLLKQLIEDDLNNGDVVIRFSELIPEHSCADWALRKTFAS